MILTIIYENNIIYMFSPIEVHPSQKSTGCCSCVTEDLVMLDIMIRVNYYSLTLNSIPMCLEKPHLISPIGANPPFLKASSETWVLVGTSILSRGKSSLLTSNLIHRRTNRRNVSTNSIELVLVVSDVLSDCARLINRLIISIIK